MHLSYLTLEIGHSATVIEPRDCCYADHNDGRKYHRHNVSVSAFAFTFLLRILQDQFHVAVFTFVSMPANTTLNRMAREEVVFTFARLHTMVAIISFRTNLGTLSTRPSRRASTMTVVRPAFSIVLAFAMLRAIYAIRAFRAGYLAVLALPTRSALTHTCHVMAFSPIFAVTVIRAVQPVTIRRARMLASQT